MVLLLRLAPMVPFVALNYAMGATSVGLWPYTWASALGIVPGAARCMPGETACESIVCSGSSLRLRLKCHMAWHRTAGRDGRAPCCTATKCSSHAASLCYPAPPG